MPRDTRDATGERASRGEPKPLVPGQVETYQDHVSVRKVTRSTPPKPPSFCSESGGRS